MKRLKEITLHNWKIKIFSFFIGISLWFYINNSREITKVSFHTLNITVARNIPVMVKNVKREYFYLNPEKVDIYFLEERNKRVKKVEIFKPYIEPENMEIGEKRLIDVKIEKPENIIIFKIVPSKIVVIRRR